jgi:predicted ATPase
VSLFVERAQGIAPSFSMVDGDEAAAVTEICQRLDGIPLAIELAASRMASMTASEMRDRLDHRFRLLVGSRRGLERHHTLRHAVAWSYDLLDDTEKTVLDRCSVFARGFDLQSACAVAGSDDLDEYAILEVLDALVRKSLLIADRSSGRTRFSMLETIRQFAEEQLAASGATTEARTAHARFFAGRETDILALWDSPRQREAYDWFNAELANLRTAFRWAADHNDLDVAIAVAYCAYFFGLWVEQYEPIAWVEELIGEAACGRPSTARATVCGGRAVPHGRTRGRRCRIPRSQPTDSERRRIRSSSVRGTNLDRYCVQPRWPTRAVG